ncbi:hypothetical protein FUAX_40800 (plasmid) [Fulvitalea axinellae]|uniref:Uncharacterized protein n=1 Tax=Fulvitalea axinellae TaxID=1182444 RepID=A0AAU9D6K3_9BACT|nr:hypothetical protein FUAX_40800 [Fulvitalea axinellae]
MLRPEMEIEIGDLLFKGCVSFEVTRDVDRLSVTGLVTLPLKAVLKGEGEVTVSREVRPGDAVTVRAGYRGHGIREVFRGFAVNVDPSDRVRIRLEDQTYLLRKKAVVFDKRDYGKSLAQICAKLVEGTDLKVSDRTAKVKIDKMNYSGNSAGALARIKETLNLSCYFDNGELYVGGAQLNPKGSAKCIYGVNIIKNSLKYEYAETNPVMVEVVGKMADGEEVKVTKGMEGGSKMTFVKYNVTDKKLLERMATEILERYSFDGFRGSLTLKFLPWCEPGGSVDYSNASYGDGTAGRYFVRSVKYAFSGSSGLTQTVRLGPKLTGI